MCAVVEPPTTARPTLFGREPALLLGLVSGLIAVVSSSVLPLNDAQQGVLNTVVAAVLGLVVAIKVRGGTWAAAMIALVQALIAAALAFKFDLSADLQSGLMLLVTGVASFATRQIVTAPQPPAVPGSSSLA